MGNSSSLDVVKNNLHFIEKLHSRLNEFNIFELLGTGHLELAHTRILAFLFDPHAAHGYGNKFARNFLKAVKAGNDPNLARRYFAGIQTQSFKSNDIRREYKRVDLLVIDHDMRTVLLLENKVLSREHSNQLQRYREAIQLQFVPEIWRIVPIYLTINGDQPTDPSYLVADYRMISHVLERLLDQRYSPTNNAARIVVEHYDRLIRRQLVGDWDTAAQAKQLYDLHPEAFEFIVQNKHYPRAEMQQLLSRLIAEAPTVEKELEEGTGYGGTVTYIRFSHPAFDHLEASDRLERDQLWTKSRRILLFQFDIRDNSVVLGLFVGPGPEKERQHLLSIARTEGAPFNLNLRITPSHAREWRMIYENVFLSPSDFHDLDLGLISQRINERWNDFLSTELSKVVTPFKQARSWDSHNLQE